MLELTRFFQSNILSGNWKICYSKYFLSLSTTCSHLSPLVFRYNPWIDTFSTLFERSEFLLRQAMSHWSKQVVIRRRWMDLIHDFLCLKLLCWIHFSSPMTIWCKSSFSRWSSSFQFKKPSSRSCSFNWYGRDLEEKSPARWLFFQIIPIMLKRYLSSINQPPMMETVFEEFYMSPNVASPSNLDFQTFSIVQGYFCFPQGTVKI